MFQDRTILFLEDEPLVAIDTTEQLEDMGFSEVATFYRLENAMNAIEERSFDFALLDINLGGGQTSHELGQALQDDGTIVVFASGNSGEVDTLTEQGYVFLHKPYTERSLKNCLASQLA